MVDLSNDVLYLFHWLLLTGMSQYRPKTKGKTSQKYRELEGIYRGVGLEGVVGC
jgi:hypothetical protein